MTTTTVEQHAMKKPPRPWSADINHKRKMLLSTPEQSNKCYTSRSDTTHDKYGRIQDTKLNVSCCLHGCRNPPNTPVCAITTSRAPQLPGRQPLPLADEGRCIRLRTISHSAPPLNFPTNWNPLMERHPGSAFDIVSSSAGSSRTCTPEQTESRAELCRGGEFIYDHPIVKPIPIKRSLKFYPQISEESVKEKLDSDGEEETLPDRLFREQLQEKKRREEMLMMNKIPPPPLSDDYNGDSDSDSSLTLPDRIFKAHMAKQAMERGCSPTPSADVKPKIIGKSGGGSIRNGLKDKFVLNIIESFNNDQSNALKELSNMRLDSNCTERKPKKTKKKSFGTLKKTWSSIMNLAVGVPTGSDHVVQDRLHHAKSRDNVSSKKNHVESLYTESMYSSLVGSDVYKSRSTACIAAL